MHLSWLAWIIAKPFGNGLLIGIGGNGRHSLTKLASFINQAQIYKIELSKAYSKNEWTEDLKGLYKTLGLDNKKITFMFTDSDLKEMSFMEDINNILNTGEVPHLFTKEEEEDIALEMERSSEKKIKNGLLEFLSWCWSNLHMMILMSPAGDMLWLLIRNYPSLVNCTTIDWFMQWPKEALEKVGSFFLASTDFDESTRNKILDVFVESHLSA